MRGDFWPFNVNLVGFWLQVLIGSSNATREKAQVSTFDLQARFPYPLPNSQIRSFSGP